MSEANRLRTLYFLVFCCTASLLPLFADYLKAQGMTGLETGLLISVTPLMALVVQPFYAILADRLGPKRALILSAAAAAMSSLLYLLNLPGFVALFAITVGFSLFYNALQPLLDSLALQLTARDSAFSYGSLRIAGAVGWSFTGIVLGRLIDSVGIHTIFWYSASSLFLTFIFAFYLQTGAEKNTPSSAIEADSPSAWVVFSNKRLLLFLLSVFFVSVGSSAIWFFYSIYMHENGASASLVGSALSFQGLCELPFFYFSARIIARFGLGRTLLVTIFTTVLRLLLYSWVRTPEWAVCIEILQGISWSLYWVVCVEYVNALVPVNWRVTGQSLLYAAYLGAGAIVGNLWTGYLADTQLRISEIYLLNAGIVAATGLGTWLFLRKTV